MAKPESLKKGPNDSEKKNDSLVQSKVGQSPTLQSKLDELFAQDSKVGLCPTLQSKPKSVKPVARPFGLRNPGVLCHFNSLMQMMASCPAVAAAAAAHPAYFAATPTGKAFAAAVADLSGKQTTRDMSPLYAVFVQELRAARPGFKYGAGQESVSEGFVLLMDVMDGKQKESPLRELFEHVYEHTTTCMTCGAKRVVRDNGVTFDLYDMPPTACSTPEAFMKWLWKRSTEVDFKCGAQRSGSFDTRLARGSVTCPGKRATRVSRLKRIGKIVVCTFNLPEDRKTGATGNATRHRYTPPAFDVPGRAGAPLSFARVAQVEHAGGSSSGHYSVLALRTADSAAGAAVYNLNDEFVNAGNFSDAGSSLYITAYHAV